MTRREIRDKIFKIVFTAEFNTLDEMRDQMIHCFMHLYLIVTDSI